MFVKILGSSVGWVNLRAELRELGHTVLVVDSHADIEVIAEPVTLRAQCAMAALTGLMSNNDTLWAMTEHGKEVVPIKSVVELCVQIGDAMAVQLSEVPAPATAPDAGLNQAAQSKG